MVEITAKAALCGLAIALGLYVFLWEFWFVAHYEYQRKKHGCGKLKVRTSWPFGIPFTRRVLGYIDKSVLLEKVTEESEAVGPVHLAQRLFSFGITSNDPENIKAVLSTNFNDYDLGLRNDHASAFGRSGIFMVSGQPWKHSRTMLRPQFSRERLSQLGSVGEHAQALIDKIVSEQADQTYVDIQPLFHSLTFDTATEFLLGTSTHTLTPSKEISVEFNGMKVSTHEFVESFLFMMDCTLRRMLLKSFWWVVNSKKLQYHTQRANNFLDYFVHRALERTASRGESYDKEEDTAEHSSFIDQLAKVTRDPIYMRDQVFSILIAGRDTTAASSAFLVYYLAQNPEVFARLRAEIIANLGTHEEQRDITFDMIRGCKYLQNVVRETLRLAPAVPLNTRTAIRDTQLPVGGGPDGAEPVFVPKGTEVVYNVFALHRDKNVWGQDADSFRPERWDALEDMHKWAYVPFNGGPRICLGQQFAIIEISLTVVRLLQRFSAIKPEPNIPMDPLKTYALTIKVGGRGVPIRFID